MSRTSNDIWEKHSMPTLNDEFERSINFDCFYKAIPQSFLRHSLSSLANITSRHSLRYKCRAKCVKKFEIIKINDLRENE